MEVLRMVLFLELAGLALSIAAHVVRTVGAPNDLMPPVCACARRPTLHDENTKMSNNASISPNIKMTSFLSRVFDNDALKKGVAAAAAGVLIAVVSEAIWPSDS